MSKSFELIGFKPVDVEFNKMLSVWESCKKAGIEIPEAVCEFFNDEDPDFNGVKIYLDKKDGVSEYRGDGEEGLEINLTKLPKDIKILRFVISY